MITFKINKEIQYDSGFQLFWVMDFDIDFNDYSYDDIISQFIKVYKLKRSALVSNNIELTDYRICSKAEISTYLIKFINSTEWGEDRLEFAELLDNYLITEKNFSDTQFYLIDKSWFGKDSDKVDEILNEHYIYYFHFIYINKETSEFVVIEWLYE